MDNPRVHRSILARGSVVRVAVFACILLVMAMTASLWSHWATIKEPTTAIAIVGDASLDGTRIVVEGINDEAQREKPVEAKLTAANKYAQAIYRYPGTYRVTAYPPGSGDRPMISPVEMTIDRFHGAQIDLPTTVTIIGQPGDRVTLTSATGGRQLYEPNEANRYRIVIYLGPGKYRLTRSHGGAVVPPDDDLMVEAHKPLEVTLPHVP